MKTLEQIRECQIILQEDMDFLTNIILSHKKIFNLFSNPEYTPNNWDKYMRKIIWELFCSDTNQFIVDGVVLRRIIVPNKNNRYDWSLPSFLRALNKFIYTSDPIFHSKYFKDFDKDLKNLSRKNPDIKKALSFLNKAVLHNDILRTKYNKNKPRVFKYGYETLERIHKQISEIFYKYVDIFQKYHIKHSISQFTTLNPNF